MFLFPIRATVLLAGGRARVKLHKKKGVRFSAAGGSANRWGEGGRQP